MHRIDTHAHLIPPDYRKALSKANFDDAGGRALPDWSPEAALQAMSELSVATAILSVSMLLAHVGEADAAARVESAVADDLASRDPNNPGSTVEIGERLAKAAAG